MNNGAELVAPALAMKEVVCFSKMMMELAFEAELKTAPLYNDNTPNLFIIGNTSGT